MAVKGQHIGKEHSKELLPFRALGKNSLVSTSDWKGAEYFALRVVSRLTTRLEDASVSLDSGAQSAGMALG